MCSSDLTRSQEELREDAYHPERQRAEAAADRRSDGGDVWPPSGRYTATSRRCRTSAKDDGIKTPAEPRHHKTVASGLGGLLLFC